VKYLGETLHCAGHRAFNSLSHTLNPFDGQIQSEATERASES